MNLFVTSAAIFCAAMSIAGCNALQSSTTGSSDTQDLDNMSTSSIAKSVAIQSASETYANHGKKFLGNKFDESASLNGEGIPASCAVSEALKIGLEGALKAQMDGRIPTSSDGQQFSSHCPEELADSIQRAFDAGADLRNERLAMVSAKQKLEHLDYMASSNNISSVQRQLLNYQLSKQQATLQQTQQRLEEAQYEFDMISQEVEG